MAGNPYTTLDPGVLAGCTPGTANPLPLAPFGLPDSPSSCSPPGGGGTGLPEPGLGGDCPYPEPTDKDDWACGCEGEGTVTGVEHGNLPFTIPWSAYQGPYPPNPWCLGYYTKSENEFPGIVEGRFTVALQYIGSGTPPRSVEVEVTVEASADSIDFGDGGGSPQASNGLGDAPVGSSIPGTVAQVSSGTHSIPVQIGSDGKGRYDIAVRASIAYHGTQNGASVLFEIVGVVENP